MTPQTETDAPIDLVSKLIARLHAQNVHFCHWKSNRGLENALAGHEDLDVLTRREDAGRFAAVLAELDFKQLRSGLDRQFPGIEDHIGYDEPSGRIVHIQLHFRLTLGEPIIKNHLFPAERRILTTLDERGRTVHGMPIPRPADELAIYVMRTLIKFKPYHLLKPSVLPQLLDEAKGEFEYLSAASETRRAAGAAAEIFPGLPTALFEECVARMSERASAFRILATRQRAATVLRHFRRRGAIETNLDFIARRLSLARERRRYGRAPKRTPADGGRVVAFVGSDGSGKSTSLDGIERWIHPFLNVTRGHLGKPPRTAVSRLADRIVSLTERLSGTRAAPARTPIGQAVGGGMILHTLYAWQLSRLARDRAAEAKRLRARARQGDLVLCDRFPLPGLHSMEGAHGDRLDRAASRIARRFVRAEKEAYESIEPPDLVLALRVPAEVAIKRQPGDGAEFVSFRAQEFFEYTSVEREGLVPIDATRPIEEVARVARRRIWDVL